MAERTSKEISSKEHPSTFLEKFPKNLPYEFPKKYEIDYLFNRHQHWQITFQKSANEIYIGFTDEKKIQIEFPKAFLTHYVEKNLCFITLNMMIDPI